MKKRILSIVLICVTLMTSFIFVGCFDKSGSCGAEGSKVKWKLSNGTHTLTISGTGDMANFTHSTTPWAKYDINIYEVIIEEGVTSIGDSAFSGCEPLNKVTLPNSLTKIGNKVFFGRKGLKSIVLGDNVTSIGDSAFQYCNGLTDINFPNSLTHIGEAAFNGASLENNIVIPNGMTSISKKAFESCDMTSVKIPDSVTSIGDYAFSECHNLASVELGKGVTSIENQAFDYCDRLVEVINHSGLEISKGSTENGCIGANAIDIHTEESRVTEKDDYVFYTSDGTNYLLGYNGTATELVLPDNYNGESYRIHNNAFKKNSELTSITIPSRVTYIGKNAFNSCTSLTSATFESTVGWVVIKDYTNPSSIMAIPSTDLINKSTAAQYLRGDYSGYYWETN